LEQCADEIDRLRAALGECQQERDGLAEVVRELLQYLKPIYPMDLDLSKAEAALVAYDNG
jgi:hypothetical protein